MCFSSKRELLIAILLGAAVVAVPPAASAQEELRVAEELEQSRNVNEAKREATISANVDFSMEERSAFWPLYWEYRGLVNKVDDDYIRILEDYSDNYQYMSDSKARKITKAWLQVQLDRYNLKKQYIEKFETALPAAKALRIFQIENRLDVMLDAALGKQIPLAVPRD